MIFFSLISKEDECLERDGWCLPGTNDNIRSILFQRITDLAAKLNLESSEEGTGSPQTILQPPTGEELGGHEGVQSFLEMLQNDDDIEAYDIFDDLSETGEMSQWRDFELG